MRKIFGYLDLETTGDDPAVNGIHEIGLIIEVGGEIVDEIELKVRPRAGCAINEVALRYGNVTCEEIMKYEYGDVVLKKLLARLSKIVNVTDPRDRIILSGYNVAGFDQPFFKSFFDYNQRSEMYNAFFRNIPLDVASLALDYLIDNDIEVNNYKQSTIAMALGIEVDFARLHTGLYDASVSRLIRKKIKENNGSHKIKSPT